MKMHHTVLSSVRGDPVLMRRINGWLAIFWIVMIPVSIVTNWIHSVAYVSALSLWALVSGHWSAWQASRVEVEQQREHQEEMDHPTEQRVVEAIVEQTTIDRLETGASGAAAGTPAASPTPPTVTTTVTSTGTSAGTASGGRAGSGSDA